MTALECPFEYRLLINQVEHGSIKASYAIPPAASFVCSPTSLRVRTGKHGHSRYTYCVTTKDGRRRLDCFKEDFDNTQSQGVTSSSVAVPNGLDDVAHLETLVLPAATPAGMDEHKISVLSHNGVLRLYAQALHKEEVSVQLVELHSPTQCHDVLAVRWLNFQEVRNTTLRHRPDLLVSVDVTSAFVSVLYRQKAGLKFTAHAGVWSIPLKSTISTTLEAPEIAALATYSLPDVQLWSQETDLQCSFNPKATALLVTGIKGVANIDFSSYSPRLTWQENSTDHGISSVAINNSFVATSSTTSLTVHDLKYNSSRTTLDLNQIGKKRKRDGAPTSHGFVRIVSYFRELGKLVTIRRNHLLSFELSGVSQEARLIDSIGCGDLHSTKLREDRALGLDVGIVDDVTGIAAVNWTYYQQEMTAAADAGNAARFEAVALEAVRDPDSLDHLSDQQVEFLLSKIFGWRGDNTADRASNLHGQRQLEVAIPAFTVLSSLIDHGAVNRHMVQHALRTELQARTLSHVSPGMIPAALMEADDTFVLLRNYLDITELLDGAELAAIVSMLLDRVLSTTHANGTAELPSLPLPQSHTPMDLGVDSGTEEANSMAFTRENVNVNDTELTSLLRIVIVTLEKFASFGPTVVAAGLRTYLSREEMGTLIQILRQQLFEGRHTSSVAQDVYPSPPLSATSLLEDRVSDPLLSLAATSKILIGCIDAVGSLGFLAGDSDHDFLAQIIPELRSETALATQGLQDASFLRGILRETMRFAQSADNDIFGDSSAQAIENTTSSIGEPGTIITLYSEPTMDQGDIETRSGILPLSLRAENTVALTKMRKGGGQVKDRTIREVREIENRNKGLYSFERLVL